MKRGYFVFFLILTLGTFIFGLSLPSRASEITDNRRLLYYGRGNLDEAREALENNNNGEACFFVGRASVFLIDYYVIVSAQGKFQEAKEKAALNELNNGLDIDKFCENSDLSREKFKALVTTTIYNADILLATKQK